MHADLLLYPAMIELQYVKHKCVKLLVGSELDCVYRSAALLMLQL